MIFGRQPPACADCGGLATWVEVWPQPCALVRLDGSVRRFSQQHQRYYCDRHSAPKL